VTGVQTCALPISLCGTAIGWIYNKIVDFRTR
jgi:hypothetical protein